MSDHTGTKLKHSSVCSDATAALLLRGIKNDLLMTMLHSAVRQLVVELVVPHNSRERWGEDPDKGLLWPGMCCCCSLPVIPAGWRKEEEEKERMGRLKRLFQARRAALCVVFRDKMCQMCREMNQPRKKKNPCFARAEREEAAC